MKYVSSEDLGSQSEETWAMLTSGESFVITADGKPLGVFIGANENNLRLLIEEVSRVKAELAVSHMRQKAQDVGLKKLSDEEIDQIVEEIRKSKN